MDLIYEHALRAEEVPPTTEFYKELDKESRVYGSLFQEFLDEYQCTNMVHAFEAADVDWAGYIRSCREERAHRGGNN